MCLAQNMRCPPGTYTYCPTCTYCRPRPPGSRCHSQLWATPFTHQQFTWSWTSQPRSLRRYGIATQILKCRSAAREAAAPLWGSNPRPNTYEAHTLPTELRRKPIARKPKSGNVATRHGKSLEAVKRFEEVWKRWTSTGESCSIWITATLRFLRSPLSWSHSSVG